MGNKNSTDRQAIAEILATWRDGEPEAWAVDMYLEAADALIAAGFGSIPEGEEEFKLHYHYGVNSGSIVGSNVDALGESIVRSSMGPIGVAKVERRRVIAIEDPWEDVTDSYPRTYGHR